MLAYQAFIPNTTQIGVVNAALNGLVVGAAGNIANQRYIYPASFDNTISVTGIGFTQKVFLNEVTKYVFAYYDAGDQMLEFKATPVYKTSRPEFSAVQIISCNNLHLWKKVVEDLV